MLNLSLAYFHRYSMLKTRRHRLVCHGHTVFAIEILRFSMHLSSPKSHFCSMSIFDEPVRPIDELIQICSDADSPMRKELRTTVRVIMEDSECRLHSHKKDNQKSTIAKPQLT